MDDATQNAILFGQLRTALAAGGGALVTGGVLSASTVNIILGVVMTIVPFILSALSKRQAAKKTMAREAIALNAGIEARTAGAVLEPVHPALAPEVIKTFAPSLLPDPLKAAPAV